LHAGLELVMTGADPGSISIIFSPSAISTPPTHQTEENSTEGSVAAAAVAAPPQCKNKNRRDLGTVICAENTQEINISGKHQRNKFGRAIIPRLESTKCRLENKKADKKYNGFGGAVTLDEVLMDSP
jgi:hypothetical protein